MNVDVLVGLLKRLIKDVKRKVFLILDNLRVHHASVVKAWLEKNKKKSLFSTYQPITQNSIQMNI